MRAKLKARNHNLFTCQPTPRLRTEGGIGVALAYLDTAMKAPVDCSIIKLFKKMSTFIKTAHQHIHFSLLTK